MSVVESGLWENNVDDILFGVLLIGLTFIICNFFRQILINRGIQSRTLHEFIASVQLSVFSFELNYIVWEQYSFWSYLLSIFIYSLWTSPSPTAAEPQPTANPLDIITTYLKGEIDLKNAIIIISGQILGVIFAYRIIVKFAWTNAVWLCFWKENPTYNVRSVKIQSAIWDTSVLPDFPSLSGITECFVTFLLYLTNSLINNLRKVAGSSDGDKYNTIAIALTSLFSALGAPYSGAFYNPAIATGLELSLTSGVSLPVKIWVYWIAPIFGLSLAIFLEPFILPA